MELSKIGSELLGGPEATLLLVLSRLNRPASGREVARIAGASQSTGRRALTRLAKIGLVTAEEDSHAVRYSLNRKHALWAPVQEILETSTKVSKLIGEVVRQHAGDSATAALFGSVARGEATGDSDIDIAVVVPDSFDSESRERLVDELAERAREFTGNRAQVLVVTLSEVRSMVRDHDPLIDSWREEAHTVTGEDLSVLISRASG
jgi:predicted nucleotidyltransferase